MAMICKSVPTVIIELHEKGYTEDFEAKEGWFFWVQQQMLVPLKEFNIVETYRFYTAGKPHQLCGVVLRETDVKGILMC
jgi:hypothetical protein